MFLDWGESDQVQASTEPIFFWEHQCGLIYQKLILMYIDKKVKYVVKFFF